jgi:hypothetical protein
MKKWYDINRTLSHNCLFNIVIGARGTGKSFGAKVKAIQKFKETGKQFIMLRRYKAELDFCKLSYFDDVIYEKKFPDDCIEFVDDCYMLNGEVMGYAMALTNAKNYKSSSFPLVWLILYEEFLIEENGHAHYLQNEVEQFLSFYMSIDRYRGVIAFFLANNTTVINPYTVYWNLYLPYNSNFFKAKNGQVLLEMVNVEGFEDERKQTRFGKLIAGTPFSDFAISNKARQDTKTFIMKKTPKSHYYFTIKYRGETFGLWVDYSEGKMFCSYDVDPTCKLIYSLTVDDHEPNTMLIKSISKSLYLKNFVTEYKSGNVYFESQRVKSTFSEIIKLCLY